MSLPGRITISALRRAVSRSLNAQLSFFTARPWDKPELILQFYCAYFAASESSIKKGGRKATAPVSSQKLFTIKRALFYSSLDRNHVARCTLGFPMANCRTTENLSNRWPYIRIQHVDFLQHHFPPWTVRHVSSVTIKFSSGRANRDMMAGHR